MLLAIGQRIVAPELGEIAGFAMIGGGTFVAAIAITYLTDPTRPEVLKAFFRDTKPFGFWQPVRDRIAALEMDTIRAENRRDIWAICLAVPWQLVLFLTTMMFVTRAWDTFFTLLGVLVALTVGLYFTWFRHLSTAEEAEASPAP
jgi:hypothetical protein